MTLGPIGNALAGIRQNQRRFENASSEIARVGVAAGEDAPDVVAAAADLLVARRGLEASLAVARASDEMLGTVIDELA